MKSIEELATLVWNQGSPPVRGTPEKVIDFATRFLAAYMKQQKPVATVVRGAHGTTSVSGQFILDLPHGTTLYAAPVVPADMVLVPREPTEAMIRASWDCAGLTSPADGKRKYIAIAWHAMIAAWEKKS